MLQETRKKSSKKFCFRGEKISSKNFFFFSSPIFYRRFSLAAGNFCRFKNHILRGLKVPNTAFKNQGGLWGDFFELFSLRRTSSGFSENPCAKSITNRSAYCNTASHGRADGRTSAGRSSLIF